MMNCNIMFVSCHILEISNNRNYTWKCLIYVIVWFYHQSLHRCYCRALSLYPNNSLIWHDLANIYHLQANFLKPSTMKTQLQEYALAAAKKSILLNPGNWQHWNLLGVIASSVGMCYNWKLLSPDIRIYSPLKYLFPSFCRIKQFGSSTACIHQVHSVGEQQCCNMD